MEDNRWKKQYIKPFLWVSALHDVSLVFWKSTPELLRLELLAKQSHAFRCRFSITR